MNLDYQKDPAREITLGLRAASTTLDRVALMLPHLGARREQQCRRAMDLVRQSLGILGAIVRGSDARVLADQHARASAEFLTYLGR